MAWWFSLLATDGVRYGGSPGDVSCAPTLVLELFSRFPVFPLSDAVDYLSDVLSGNADPVQFRIFGRHRRLSISFLVVLSSRYEDIWAHLE